MRLHIIVASTRPGRVGRLVGDWTLARAEEHGGFEPTLVDLAEVALPFYDEPEEPSTGIYMHQHTRDWSATVAAADAFVFVMPEYNYGFTAPLKNALDYLKREWTYKPVAFVSYGGTSAGTRAVQMAKQVVTTLNMVPVTNAVAIHHPRTAVVSSVFDPAEPVAAAARGMFEELARFSQALAPLREMQPA